MKQSIVLYKKIPSDLLQRLEDNFDVRFFDGINETNRAEVIAALKNADGMIGASVPVRAELLDHAPKLKAISTISVGYDQFDIADLTQRKNCVDAHANGTHRNHGRYRVYADSDDRTPRFGNGRNGESRKMDAQHRQR